MPKHKDLLVGGDGLDDAAVYRLREDLAIVATVDIFTPIVDDPYDYGRIAAANALSDVYAMGATPRLALAIAGFPRDKLPLATVAEILRGGADKAAEGGCLVAGGHTIENPEPVYGLAVIGEVHPDRVVTNAGGRPGDALVLTKPLGTGLIATALRVDEAEAEWIAAATESMLRLNDAAAAAMLRHGVTACTDVTGFGLLVHAHELAQSSGCVLEVEAGAVPLLPGAIACVLAGMLAGGLYRNLDHAQGSAEWGKVQGELVNVFADPQTSGGLLIALPEGEVAALLQDLKDSGLPEGTFARVGRLVAGEAGKLRVF